MYGIMSMKMFIFFILWDNVYERNIDDLIHAIKEFTFLRSTVLVHLLN